MLRLKLILCFLLLFPVLGQQEESQKSNSQNPAYDENLEKQLENFASSQEQAAAALDLLSPEQKKKLMEAVASGDQQKVEALMKDITKSAASNPEGMQKLIKYSLSQFQQKSAGEVKADIQARVQGSLFEPVLQTFPKLLDFGVNLLRDPVALPQLFKIPADRKRLLLFLGINILLFIIKWVIKKKEKNKKAPFSERISRFIFFFGLRLVLIGVFFNDEIWPSLIVARRTFF